MAYHNLLQSGVLHFAKLAKENGWTKEETLEVIRLAQDEVNNQLASGHCCRLDSILEKYARPVIERKKKGQESE